MVRSSVVSAVSSACEIRLVPDWRCFWSTNSKRISSLAVPGSAATPCVAQLVLSTQKAEPQDAWAAPAAGSSASPQTIANCFFIFSSPQIPIRAPGSDASTSTSYAIVPWGPRSAPGGMVSHPATKSPATIGVKAHAIFMT